VHFIWKNKCIPFLCVLQHKTFEFKSNKKCHTKIVVLDGVEISIDWMMTKNNKHRVVNAVSRVADGSQWHADSWANQQPAWIGDVKTPQFIYYNSIGYSTIDINVILDTEKTSDSTLYMIIYICIYYLWSFYISYFIYLSGMWSQSRCLGLETVSRCTNV